MNTNQIYSAIDKLLTILENNFRYNYGKKIPYDEIYEIMQDLYSLITNFEKNTQKCGEVVTKRYIPIIDLLMKIDDSVERKAKYYEQLKYAYKLGARISLEHYFIYREWDIPDKDKFFAPRYPAISGYIYYLQEIVLNPKFVDLVFNAPAGFGKLLANDTPILTRNGWKKHGNLVVGDEVLSPKGDFIKVTMVHPKRLANVRVTFSDGEQIECHNQHEWQVYDKLARKEKQVETTYLMKNLYLKNGNCRFFLPNREIVKGEEKDLPIDPYTYGVWLGDGSTKQGRITENNDDSTIFKYIPYEISKVYDGVSENVKSYYLKRLANDLHKIGLCYQNKKVEKFIHDSYLTSSIEQRLELLAGIIDSDGYFDKIKQRYIITTANKKLKEDIISLIYTFGWRVCVTTTKASTSSSGIIGRNDIYQIGFNPTIKIPCKLKRKQMDKVHKQNRISFTKIELITPIEGNCITVEGGLYLAGKTLKMTHNTYPEKIAEAWSYGIDPTGAILSLCSNDDTVKSGSYLVRQEIKSEVFGEVFPKMKWDKDTNDYFLKETDGIWKLKQCKLGASYNASTCNSNVIGQRANKWIHVDDLYKSYIDAMKKEDNIRYINDCNLSWRTRYVLNAIAKMVVTGTLWASGDFIDLWIKQLKKEHKFFKHPKFPYTIISEDKSVVIIQLPALDYKTNLSVFPELKSTEELLKIKNRLDPYLWLTNYQQIPTNPDALAFSYDKLRTYETIPETEYIGAYAVIDATRKSGKDFFAMPIFKKVKNDTIYDYYLKDSLFTRTATKDMYNSIVDKIIEHHIIKLVIESNVTSELMQNIDRLLKEKGVTYCEMIEKYNTIPKATRIENEKHLIKKQLVFPKQELFGLATDIGKFMDNLTTYNESGNNANDDAPDGVALFCSEIIEENSQPQKAEAIVGLRQYI